MLAIAALFPSAAPDAVFFPMNFVYITIDPHDADLHGVLVLP
jgi:hypothetical protein